MNACHGRPTQASTKPDRLQECRAKQGDSHNGYNRSEIAAEWEAEAGDLLRQQQNGAENRQEGIR
jgi:hypothetical protein